MTGSPPPSGTHATPPTAPGTAAGRAPTDSATARAYPNLALVKYWGKRDEELILPVAGSLSLTLDAFATTTTVQLDPGAGEDRFELNGHLVTGTASDRVRAFLDLVRSRAGSADHASVRSVNEAPTGAGLASSAAGFAALATAASAAYGLDLDAPALSRLARRGSGSAARSVIGNVALWHAGTDDATSFAEEVPAPELAMVVTTVDSAAKAVSSREAMRRTARTSPYFIAWITSTETSLTEMVAACRAGDFARIGEITESHALRMHALIASTEPPIRYLQPRSIEVLDAVVALREAGIEAYSTADAGPNVAVLTRPADAARVASRLGEIVGESRVRVVGPGPGAHLVDDAVPPVGEASS
ncbi:MAG TPA: diphosphomevalonate decarboxylase [Candidatus Ruania gallistercoris]|uniref:diphosphomevalonate decarboxylase n=1 Tax=Candidatus Ruania gallistercoris TaxID=2838746 RepID=A0A9D2J4U6_9MICO|nr:diphosphomevalonate decarboxylase [Candidatus Ruania gallistercoris]